MDPFQYESDLEEYAEGEIVFRSGDEGDQMYVVASGSVEVRLAEKAVDTVGAGGIVGEKALLGSRVRSATVVAAEPCRLLPIDETFFLHLIQQSPRFSLKVMKTIADRLRRSNEPRR
jgi:CRP-like cAMP-binding protein